MAQIRGQLKRAILNSLARQAAGDNQSQPGPVLDLADALAAYADALVMGVQTGRVVEAHTGAGKAVKFRTPLLGEHFRQEDVTELAQEFLEVYADAVIALSAQSIPNPTDAQILVQMLADDRLASVTTTRVSYLYLNWPNLVR